MLKVMEKWYFWSLAFDTLVKIETSASWDGYDVRVGVEDDLRSPLKEVQEVGFGLGIGSATVHAGSELS